MEIRIDMALEVGIAFPVAVSMLDDNVLVVLAFSAHKLVVVTRSCRDTRQRAQWQVLLYIRRRV